MYPLELNPSKVLRQQPKDWVSLTQLFTNNKIRPFKPSLNNVPITDYVISIITSAISSKFDKLYSKFGKLYESYLFNIKETFKRF